jgi:hypothetical protein
LILSLSFCDIRSSVSSPWGRREIPSASWFCLPALYWSLNE